MALHIVNMFASELPLEDFLRIVDHFPRLLHFSTLGLNNWVIAGAGRTQVPYLRSLYLGAATQFLDLIEIPTLEALEVQLISGDETRPLPDFVPHWAHHLLHLRLEIMHSPPSGLEASLSAAISLVTLDISFPGARLRAFVRTGHGGTRYRFLLEMGTLHHPRSLKITDAMSEGTYSPFLAVLRVQPALRRAELHVASQHEDGSCKSSQCLPR
ncbi:hypothetical protein DFH09DRAFT_1308992 [Mycena vulgaris]|nr:hypothetical protein DFH09DRAFT_1308992 [Mycena vulgaris]